MDIKKVPAFILTAGLGMRLRPFTNIKPKPCLPFMGLPLFSYPYSLLKQGGCQDFYFNLHYKAELVRQNISDSLPIGGRIDFFTEKPQILGSGGAIWNGQSHLQKHPHFFVANGDEFLLPGENGLIEDFYKYFLQRQPLGTLLVTDHPDLLTKLKPVWINEQNHVVGFGMDPPNSQCQPVHYTGFKIFSNKIYDYIPQGESNIFYDAVVNAINSGEIIDVYRSNELQWSETGNIKGFFQSLALGMKAFSQQHFFLWQTFRYFGKDPREYVLEEIKNGFLLRHRDVFVPTTTKIEGHCFIDKNCRVGIRCQLKDVVLEEGATVEDHCNKVEQIIFKK